MFVVGLRAEEGAGGPAAGLGDEDFFFLRNCIYIQKIQSTRINTYASTRIRLGETRNNATATPSPSPEKAKPHHPLTTSREEQQALKAVVARRTAPDRKTMNEQRQPSPGRRSTQLHHRDGAPTTDPSSFDHQTRAGRGATQAKQPPNTYLGNPTLTMEETPAQRQRVRGEDSRNTRASSSPLRPSGETPADPSSTRPASKKNMLLQHIDVDNVLLAFTCSLCAWESI